MDLFGAAMSAVSGGSGPVDAIKNLFGQWVSGPEAVGKLDAILREHGLPFSGEQALGVLRGAGFLQERDGGLEGTAKLQEAHHEIPGLLQGLAGEGSPLGGLGKLFG